MLATGAGGPVGIDPQIFFLDLDINIVINHGVDPDRGKAGGAIIGKLAGFANDPKKHPGTAKSRAARAHGTDV